MKTTCLNLAGVIVLLFLGGCTKEKLTTESLVGTWNFDSFTYTHWGYNDSLPNDIRTFQRSGYMTIESNTETEFVFGQGSAALPIYLFTDTIGQLNPIENAFYEGKIALEKGPDSDRPNLSNFAYSSLQYGTDLTARRKVQFWLVDANHLVLRITTPEEGHTTSEANYNYIRIELTK